MEVDEDMKSIILFVSVFVIFFILGAIYFNLFSNTSVNLAKKKPLTAGENDICASPSLFIKCQDGLACSTQEGKVIIKYDDKKKFLGYCFTTEKIAKLQKENS